MPDADQRLRDAETRLTVLEGKQSAHEDICALRYQGIIERLDANKDQTRRMFWMIAILILSLLGGRQILDTLLNIIPGL
jgi:cobyric acid synthase